VSLRPFQFTILQLVTLSVCFAVICAVTRSSNASFVSFSLIGLNLFTNRSKGDLESVGCTIAGIILFGTLGVGAVIAAFIELSLSRRFDGLGPEVSWLAQATLGLSWGAMVSAACYSIAKLMKRDIDQKPRRPPVPPPDDPRAAQSSGADSTARN
jgi:hypothetical protein